MQKAIIPTIEITTTLDDTSRGDNAFGSTELYDDPTSTTPPPVVDSPHDDSPHIIPFDINDGYHTDMAQTSPRVQDTDLPNVIRSMTTQVDQPCQITLCTDPFRRLY